MKIASLTPLIPVGVGVFIWSKLSSSYKLLVAFFGLSSLFALTNYILAKMTVNNMPMFHMWTILETVLLLLFVRLQVKNIVLRQLFLLMAICFVIVAVWIAIFVEGLWTFNSIASTYESILFTVVAIAVLGFLFVKQQSDYIDRNPLFWISTAMLFYFSVRVFVFSMYNFLLVEDPRLISQAWDIHSGVLTLFCCLCAIGLRRAAVWSTR